MKQIQIVLVLCVLLSGCADNDIASLSKEECIKQGFHYKVEKRLNFLSGTHGVEAFCYK